MPGPRPRTGFVASPPSRLLQRLPQALRALGALPPRRLARAAATAGAAALVLAAAGCAQFDATFGQQEAVVHFQPGTSQAARLQVRAACSHVPQARPEPLPTDNLASDQLYDVRYQVGGASDAQLAQLQQCLQKFRSVAGIDFVTPGGS